MIALLVSLSGCSMVRLSYDQGPRLAWWWLDGYVDFSREQKPLQSMRSSNGSIGTVVHSFRNTRIGYRQYVASSMIH